MMYSMCGTLLCALFICPQHIQVLCDSLPQKQHKEMLQQQQHQVAAAVVQGVSLLQHWHPY